MKIKLKDLIAPQFYNVHIDIKDHKHTHYWFKGGRGSTKSSYISLEIIVGIMKDENANAVALRKVKTTIKDSIYEQLEWAIKILGVEEYWDTKTSPMCLTYIPTGQKIIFRGADKAKKIKSIKFKQGYCKFIWYEEVDEFYGIEEIRMINQSLMRGGDNYIVFYSYNPPQSVSNWVNKEALILRKDKYIHHSSYLRVNPQWLGEQFIIEAEHLKLVKFDNYRHEYLGEVIGTGGEVFMNISVREITDIEIKEWDNNNQRRGVDFGYAVDPATYAVMTYNNKLKKLYIYNEIYKTGLSNEALANLIKKENVRNLPITADSAEPKSIADLNSKGLRVKGAKKGPDSVDFGIKFLQDLEEIIIDPYRCPNAVKEFTSYELERDQQGNWKANFPDKDNHIIDATRYALEDDMKNNKWCFGG